MTPRVPPSAHHGGPRSSSPLTDQLDFGLELDAEAPYDLSTRVFDETGDVRGRGAALVDDEIAVQLGDHCRPVARALQSSRLDEPAGGVPGRVLEDAAAVLGLDRLSFVALVAELRHQTLCLFPIAALELDGRVNDERTVEGSVTKRCASESEPQAVDASRARVRARLEPAHLDQHSAQLRAPG